MERKVVLHKNRDFSLIFGETTTFIRENFRSLVLNTVLIVVPAYAIATILSSFLLTDASTFAFGTRRGPSGFSIFLMFLFYYLAYILAIGVVFKFMEISSSSTESIKAKDIWKRIGPQLIKIFFSFIGYAFILIIVSAIATIPIQFHVFKSPYLIAVYTGFYYLLIISFFSVLAPVLVIEDLGFFGSISRAFELWGKKFWRTMLVNLVAIFIVGVFGSILFALLFYLPMMIIREAFVNFVEKIFTTYLLIVFILIGLITFIFYIYYYVLAGVQYFSLLEKANFTGLKQRIDRIGETPAPPKEEF